MKTSSILFLASALIATQFVTDQLPASGHDVIEPKRSLQRELKVESLVNPDQLNQALKKQMDLPFKWGGKSPEAGGFDSSGLVSYVFKELGFNLDGNVKAQYKKTEAVDRNNLIIGDLLFWSTYKAELSHVGIYIGKDKFITVGAKQGVAEFSITNWKEKYKLLGVRHVNQSNLIMKE
ncbi:C40 family peptidase [Paenibacillus sp. LS1]|uniref:C40 family peptidase n=1 Tax=Paenibacillus sp. LS1 TaxID=2992120 RepID=UPI002231CB16|nr:C40 family peptidase [Paenibacillus sp. LS1]MCW3793735.1 C40 family peptidase [Paenibacillus sp. LS1]